MSGKERKKGKRLSGRERTGDGRGGIDGRWGWTEEYGAGGGRMEGCRVSGGREACMRRSLPGDRALPALSARCHDNQHGCRCHGFIRYFSPLRPLRHPFLPFLILFLIISVASLISHSLFLYSFPSSFLLLLPPFLLSQSSVPLH